MTTLNLDELEKLANAATPLPWTVTMRYRGAQNRDQIVNREILCGSFSLQVLEGSPENIAFAYAARTAVPELIREVRRLREALEWYANTDGDWLGRLGLDEGELAQKALEQK